MSERQRLKLRWEARSRNKAGVTEARATAGRFTLAVVAHAGRAGWSVRILAGRPSVIAVGIVEVPAYTAARLAAEEYLREILIEALAALEEGDK